MCKSQSNHPKYFMSKKGADTGSGFVVGNGKCGITCSGNSDGSVFAVDLLSLQINRSLCYNILAWPQCNSKYKVNSTKCSLST